MRKHKRKQFCEDYGGFAESRDLFKAILKALNHIEAQQNSIKKINKVCKLREDGTGRDLG